MNEQSHTPLPWKVEFRCDNEVDNKKRDSL